MRQAHALCPKTKRVSDPKQVRNTTWFKQGAEQGPGDTSSIYPSTEKSMGRLPPSSALQGPSPSLLRKPLSCTSNPFLVMPAMSAPGQSFGRSQMIQSHMKGLQGWILLIPPPLFHVFLALHLHGAFKHDLYHLLKDAPCLVCLVSSCFLQQGPAAAPKDWSSSPGKQLVWKKWALLANT